MVMGKDEAGQKGEGGGVEESERWINGRETNLMVNFYSLIPSHNFIWKKLFEVLICLFITVSFRRWKDKL